MNFEVSIKKKNFLENALTNSRFGILQILLGSIFLGLAAQLSVPLPFTPVPLSMQPLAVFLLAITLGSRKAPLAVAAYLIQATCGLPVLAGGLTNPLWMISPKAGYLVGFVIVAFLVAKLHESSKSINFFKSWIIFSIGEVALLSCGTLWLSYFIGFEKAIMLGALPFLPGALIKITIAACSVRPIDWTKSLFSKLKIKNKTA